MKMVISVEVYKKLFYKKLSHKKNHSLKIAWQYRFYTKRC